MSPGLTDAQRYELVCSPALERISAEIKEVKDSLDDLHHTVAVSNGKPSMLARLDAIEKAAAQSVAQPVTPSRVLKLGPLELSGYGINDILRAAVVIGIIWLLAQSYLGQERTERALKAIGAIAEANCEGIGP